jgi:hypothetical protein
MKFKMKMYVLTMLCRLKRLNDVEEKWHNAPGVGGRNSDLVGNKYMKKPQEK